MVDDKNESKEQATTEESVETDAVKPAENEAPAQDGNEKEETPKEEASQEEAPKEKRKHKRAPIVVGVIVAVLVVAGAGFWVWHEQPSFCNAICHTPMDPFLPTYEAEPGQASIDCWGDDVADASGMMAPVHRVEADATCLSCHVPTIGEQISEAMAWVSGSYTVLPNDVYGAVLPEYNLEQLTEARGIPSDEFCLNKDCHDVTREDLIEATSNYERNPHVSQHDTLMCGTCHKAHRASYNACQQCHSDAPVPEGWISYKDGNALKP